jgi:glycosyltransferase involved in cell wall biosynthesis
VRIDFGTASYNNPAKLDKAITAFRQKSKSDWRLLVVDNNSSDDGVREVIERHISQDSRIVAEFNKENLRYVGAVNRILSWAETNNVGYIDNDAYI